MDKLFHVTKQLDRGADTPQASHVEARSVARTHCAFFVAQTLPNSPITLCNICY
ncbi:hypothetical protein GCM10023214_67480 [Amycolatopsis dongchuanensis]|uniref:Uncharacterized protein n=1 Tax=Amycolatopsis dongchuanensis TaxID=1070866 RepID=A0ABP8VIY6_9PSEU